MSKKKVIPGKNFLHTHPFREMSMDVGEDHVIVDRKDWERTIKILSHEDNLKRLNKWLTSE